MPAHAGLPAAPPTPFIGREDDLRQVAEAFEQGRRLVTVWGPGGIGKTRLGLEYAARQGRPAVFCDLASCRTREAVCATVASTLDVALAGGGAAGDPDGHVARVLAARGPLLLLLDNFEQVVGTSATLLTSWIAAAPSVGFLVTSRERLRLRGELAHEVEALALPQGDDVSRSEAVQLFIASAGGSFELTRQNAPRVARLVERLEGIPLAIELAAARVDPFGVDGLLSRLSERFELLAGGVRDLDSRQATLHGAIEWSWDLLSEAERRALVELALFRGPFAIAAAEAVLTASSAERPLTLIQSLRNKSLIRSVPSVESTEPRLALFEVVREFAEGQRPSLARDDAAAVRHADHYLELGEQLAEDLGPPGPESIRRLALDVENLMAIVERALDASPIDASRAVRALLVIEPVLATRGPAGQLLFLLDRAVEVADRALPVERARLFAARGRAHLVRGEIDAADDKLAAAMAEAHGAGDRRVEAQILTDRGVLHHQVRDLDRARDCYERAMGLVSGFGDPRAEGRLLGNLGALLHDQRQFDAASEHYHDALGVLGGAADPRLQGIVLTNIGVLEQERGDLTNALETYTRALEHLGRGEDRRLEAIALGNLGSLYHERGELESAETAQRKGLHGLRVTGDRRSEALALTRLAAVLAGLDRIDEAQDCIANATVLAGTLEDPPATASVELARAFIDLAEASRARSAEAHDAVNEHLARARSRISRAYEPAASGDAAPAKVSDDVRMALRLLAGLTGGFHADLAIEPSCDALVIAAEARWFRPPGGDWQDLNRHQLLRRLLVVLVEHRHVAAGRGVSLQALQRAAWPGERIRPDAAANRLYVAISKLRRLGLRAHLLRQDDGYLLEPSLRVQRWEGEPQK